MNESIVLMKDVLVYIAMFAFLVISLRIFAEISCIRKRIERWVEADTERAIRECGQQPFKQVYEGSKEGFENEIPTGKNRC
jgi:hypothetical protein